MSSDEGELLLRQLLRLDPSLRQLDITLLGGDGPNPKTVTVAAIVDVLESYPRAERLVLRGLPPFYQRLNPHPAHSTQALASHQRTWLKSLPP
jgi:hypothetical protein